MSTPPQLEPAATHAARAADSEPWSWHPSLVTQPPRYRSLCGPSHVCKEGGDIGGDGERMFVHGQMRTRVPALFLQGLASRCDGSELAGPGAVSQ